MPYSIDRAEELKTELTDKYVVVDANQPHLKRFAKRTGIVKTVNMNGRALVQFDAPEDISWYDIDPTHLKIVAKPQPKPKAEEAPAKEPAATKTSATAAKPASGKKLSPIEMARQQDAAKKAAAAGASEKKLSPIELARQQDAAKKAAAADAGKKLSPIEQARQQDAARKAAEKPAPSAPPAGKKLSPLEMARMQDKKKSE
ncbi:hypothetical protein [Thalassoroseus pseudoceratinae]|uniref:hypothetical protein n=1 Tax=Thalassoroseus pseudoceratinae TaxID=2713176 RepID=UPI00141FCD74|nr:hypothetical protein [Thalassoroseus pseudoceratinae]